MEKNLCKVKGYLNEGRYCRLHPSGSLKEPKKIVPRSEKLAKVMKKEYVPQVKEMVEKNTPCKVKSPVCTGKAQLSYPAGRIGKELLTTRKIPCCNMCNTWIEANDAWARANGFKVSRHSNYKREK
jgi:hypothetical protein